jgi:hypothetical protein
MGKRHTPEPIVRKLRAAELDPAGGMTVGRVCQKLGVSEQTFARWRQARSVPLPADLFDALVRIAGPSYLWQHYPTQLRDNLKARGWPAHQLRLDFDPARMAAWVMTLFADYHEDHPDRPRITSHQFRKKAFTDAYRAGVPLDAAAIAFGCDPTTIRGHYLGVSEAEIADSVFAKLDGLSG